ncbi:phytanoyl-CoA dioxygenase family protein [Paenibacillus sp. OV219]|uniref:phytanoyl-CoA dioxygenase family protein n=1 Tax=Paenibacillus sp. OV219 TaxID=1884377 RepID=UPI0008D272BF|nr:phytanoyl-CoA dioxygenase family protein [Paenibacillus sp. OV219]SEO31879.1 Ectoine hydroxylase-related dioxygenase, phytanoyl-CoA dioxygenase (PhyH) family [Paenibacillus sp. OV219]
MLLKLTEQERLTGVPEQETIEIAIEQIKKNGYIGFESVLSAEQIAELKDAFLPMFNEYIERFGYNTGTNRAQMHLPFVQPFINDYMIANAFALPVIKAVLGEGVRATYLASDTACPGSDYQNVHSDMPPLFPDLGVALPAYSLVMNIPLVDVNAENGPLEVWPGGTHLDPENTKHTSIDGPDVRAAKTMYSEKIHMPAGSIVIRDIRMWHRGTPNVTNENRTNIALIYNNDWYGAGGSIHVPQEAYDQASKEVKSLFRCERIGVPAKMPWQW